MRIFKYWIEHSEELNIEGNKQTSKVYGGSNVSESDALIEAKEKLRKAQLRINGELKNEDYDADIVEEIITKIDDDNIVTRNRYGALVLNSKKMMFIDIDTHSKSFTDSLFRSKLSRKQLMLAKIERIVKKRKYIDFGFRIYETKKGFRVLITNKDFNAKSRESKQIMQEFNADYLYQSLCTKQNCYRARLTPKPYRIKQKGIKVQYPKRSVENERILSIWVKEYEQKSQRFSTCHLVKEFGKTEMNSAIRYHDKMVGIKHAKQLA